MMNFGLLTVEIGWRVCGTPANFNGFRVLASLLHQRRSTELTQTLHDVWRSPGMVHCVYIFGGHVVLFKDELEKPKAQTVEKLINYAVFA